MAAAPRRWAAELLHFWFQRMRPGQWFGHDAAADEQLRRRFARDLSMLRRQPPRAFLRDPLTARAGILLFDQMPRNLHRGSPEAFACDPLARAIAKGATARGWHRQLGKRGCQFLYMPLMHSEAKPDQRLALRLFAALGDPSITRFARAHARMIARFGRFPHRNVLLGRKSSAAELRAIAAGNVW